jgi:hypothetical protein
MSDTEICDFKKKKRKCLPPFRKFTFSEFIEWGIPEFFGTFLFTLFGSASSSTASGVGLNGAFGNGIVLAAILWMVSNEKSGGKLNPAVSAMVYLTQIYDSGGKTDAKYKEYASAFLAFVLEVGSQIAGGIAAGFTLKYLLPDASVGCFVPVAHAGPTFAWEFLGAFLLIGVIRALNQVSEIGDETYKGLGPLIIGLSLFAGAQSAGPFTGAAFNPARYLANVGMGCRVNNSLQYCGAHFSAAVAVSLITWLQSSAEEFGIVLDKNFNKSKIPRTEIINNSDFRTRRKELPMLPQENW